MYNAGYTSLDVLKNADVVELNDVDLISPTVARKIKHFLLDSAEVSEFVYLEESIEDREKFSMKFGLNPGRLLLKFRHSKIFRLIPQFMLILIFIIFGVILGFVFLFFPFMVIISFYILTLIFIILLIIGYADYYYWNLDFIRIYEHGILLSRRKEGVHSKPPTTYWGFALYPIWQSKFGYRYIPKSEIAKIYPINVNDRFMGFNIIDTHGRWINSNFMVIYSDYRHQLHEILESLQIIYGTKWDSLCGNTIEIKIPWGFDYWPD